MIIQQISYHNAHVASHLFYKFYFIYLGTAVYVKHLRMDLFRFTVLYNLVNTSPQLWAAMILNYISTASGVTVYYNTGHMYAVVSCFWSRQ